MPRASIRERFPAPWRVEPVPGGFRVVDSVGAALVYVYAYDEMQRKAMTGRQLTRGEARAIASAIARLPYCSP